MSWDLIKRYIVFQGFVLIYLKNNTQPSFVLSDQEINKDEFLEIVSLLKEKISSFGKRIVESNVKL